MLGALLGGNTLQAAVDPSHPISTDKKNAEVFSTWPSDLLRKRLFNMGEVFFVSLDARKKGSTYSLPPTFSESKKAIEKILESRGEDPYSVFTEGMTMARVRLYPETQEQLT
jgi:hypothetical protein